MEDRDVYDKTIVLILRIKAPTCSSLKKRRTSKSNSQKFTPSALGIATFSGENCKHVSVKCNKNLLITFLHSEI